MEIQTRQPTADRDTEVLCLYQRPSVWLRITSPDCQVLTGNVSLILDQRMTLLTHELPSTSLLLLLALDPLIPTHLKWNAVFPVEDLS